MARKIKIKDADEHFPRCKNCYHKGKHDADEKAFACYRYPEVIITDDEGVPWQIRPEISDEQRACGEFKPIN